MGSSNQLNPSDFYSQVPAEELADGSEPVLCEICGSVLVDACIAGPEDGVYCEDCIEREIQEIAKDAIRYAHENCRVTTELPEYDPEREYKCTPEEYESGNKDSYTLNAFGCFCRHECTNYDELKKSLDPDALKDKVYYQAIRNRIVELLDEHGCEGGDWIC